MIDFSEQVVVVTGAGRGLGAAYARLLARRGAHVVVHDAGVDRDGTGGDPAVAESVAAELRSEGHRVDVEVQDLADRVGCETLVRSVLEGHGRIDALVHNAGVVRYGRIDETSPADWERMLAINVNAAWWLCRAAWSPMVDRSYGRIVLTTSGFALRPIPGADVTGYSVGKAAQVGLMNGLAAEGEPHGILVNCIEPVAATRIFRREVAPDAMSPDAVAPAVALLASTACRWSGQVLMAQDGEFAFDRVVRTQVRQLGPSATPEDLLAMAGAEAPDLRL